MSGYRHVPISVAASFDCLRESAIKDRQTALVSPLATFRLWWGFRRKAALLSINRMEAGDIQRGRGGRFSLGGTGYRALRFWNLSSALLRSLAGRSLSGNDILPLRYRKWKRVGQRRSHDLGMEWSDEKFRMLQIPTIPKPRRFGPRM